MNPHCAQATHCLQYSHSRFSLTNVPLETTFDLQSAPDVEYQHLKEYDHSVLHWGQLKLLVGELEFFAPYMDAPEVTVVYAGASPGHHLPVLMDLLPKTWKWLLYDQNPSEVFCDMSAGSAVHFKPRKNAQGLARPIKSKDDAFHEMLKKQHFMQAIHYIQDKDIEDMFWDISNCIAHIANKTIRDKRLAAVPRRYKKNVKSYTRMLTCEECKEIHNRHVLRTQSACDPQLLCVCDLRTNKSEESVAEDMALQEELVASLRPFQASLKFKLPYSDQYPQAIPYLAGTLHYQAFSPRVSHECRLHTTTGSSTYDRLNFCKQMYHFQSTLRTSVYEGPEALADPSRHPSLAKYGVCIDNCFDCRAALRIVAPYAAKLGHAEPADLMEKIVHELSLVEKECFVPSI